MLDGAAGLLPATWSLSRFLNRWRNVTLPVASTPLNMDGAAGLEPAIHGTKTRCLTSLATLQNDGATGGDQTLGLALTKGALYP